MPVAPVFMANLTEELMDALERLLRHEPWPPSVQSERDYLYASDVLSRGRRSVPASRREAVLGGEMSECAGTDQQKRTV